nr:nuclease domain-containing protein [Pseudomonas cavernicola]
MHDIATGFGFIRSCWTLTAWACSSCHDEIDRRTRHIDADSASLAHLEGVIRTQAVLLKEGKLAA